LGSDLLAVCERRIDRRPAGDDGRELLRALVANVLELRDADVLDAGVAGPPGRPGVVDRRGFDGVDRGLGECAGGVLVIRDLVW
jgi:hypothetical protein